MIIKYLRMSQFPIIESELFREGSGCISVSRCTFLLLLSLAGVISATHLTLLPFSASGGAAVDLLEFLWVFSIFFRDSNSMIGRENFSLCGLPGPGVVVSSLLRVLHQDEASDGWIWSKRIDEGPVWYNESCHGLVRWYFPEVICRVRLISERRRSHSISSRCDRRLESDVTQQMLI